MMSGLTAAKSASAATPTTITGSTKLLRIRASKLAGPPKMAVVAEILGGPWSGLRGVGEPDCRRLYELDDKRTTST